MTFYNPAVAPSGASFYRGQRFPSFTGDLFVATLRGTHLHDMEVWREQLGSVRELSAFKDARPVRSIWELAVTLVPFVGLFTFMLFAVEAVLA